MAEEVGGPVGGVLDKGQIFFMETAQLGIVPARSLCLRSHLLKVVLSLPGGQASPFAGTPGGGRAKNHSLREGLPITHKPKLNFSLIQEQCRPTRKG